jgi:hypothetical protein
MENAQKFVWAYIIEQGLITNGTWSYYGGHWEYENKNDSWKKIEKRKQKLLDDVKKIGIAWDKMKIPVSSHESVFDGTDHDAGSTGTLLGTLILKDGTSYLLGVSGVNERIGAYMKFLSDTNEDKQRVKNILGEDLT